MALKIYLYMSVLYYYYYFFYTKILPDDEPHATVIFTLSFSEALLVNYVIEFFSAHLLVSFCWANGQWF